MKSRILGGIISIVICGFFAGFALHHTIMVRHDAGRDAFLTAQGARFDRDYANPPPVVMDIFVSIILLALLIGIYELIAFVVSKTVKSLDDTEGS